MNVQKQVNPDAPSNEVSIVTNQGWEVNYDTALTADVELPNYVCKFHIGGGGDLILEGKHGTPIPYYGLLDGDYVIEVSKKVLYQAVINGTLRTTTTTKVTAHGGQ